MGWEKEEFFFFFFGLLTGFVQTRHRSQPQRVIALHWSRAGIQAVLCTWAASVAEKETAHQWLTHPHPHSTSPAKPLYIRQSPYFHLTHDITHESCLAIDMPTTASDGFQGKHTSSEWLSSFPGLALDSTIWLNPSCWYQELRTREN